jgi:Secretion system C-terminal sorting domain
MEVPVILGNSLIPATRMMGFASEISFDPTKIDANSFSLLLDNSALGDQDSLLSVSKVLLGNEFHIAIARSNDKSSIASVAGEIARIRFYVLPTASGDLGLNLSGNTKLLAKHPYLNFTPVLHYENANLQSFVSDIVSSVDASNRGAITVYPNPAQNQLTIESQSDIQQVQILSISGKQVLSTNESKHIDLSSLAAGFYMIKVFTTTGVYQQKLIKE